MKRMPSFAILSMCGVSCRVEPSTDMSLMPRSSARMKRKLGLSASAKAKQAIDNKRAIALIMCGNIVIY